MVVTQLFHVITKPRKKKESNWKRERGKRKAESRKGAERRVDGGGKRGVKIATENIIYNPGIANFALNKCSTGQSLVKKKKE